MEAVARDRERQATPATSIEELRRRERVRGIGFDAAGWEDFLFWLGADLKMARRIVRLIAEIHRDWSRRIDNQHRLVYRATDDEVIIRKAPTPLLSATKLLPQNDVRRMGPAKSPGRGST